MSSGVSDKCIIFLFSFYLRHWLRCLFVLVTLPLRTTEIRRWSAEHPCATPALVSGALGELSIHKDSPSHGGKVRAELKQGGDDEARESRLGG